jgi:hypothetical protein
MNLGIAVSELDERGERRDRNEQDDKNVSMTRNIELVWPTIYTIRNTI